MTLAVVTRTKKTSKLSTAEAVPLRSTGRCEPMSTTTMQMTIISARFALPRCTAGILKTRVNRSSALRMGRVRSSFCFRHRREKHKSP